VKNFISVLFVLSFSFSYAQSSKDTTATKLAVDSINRLLDHAVVQKNLPVLQKHYAEDFFFQHATGIIDSKATWINSIQTRKNPYASREHDSIVVELHSNVAIVSGSLSVRVKEPDKVSGYALRYIRVFVYKNSNWQLISHHSTAEWNLKDE